MSNIQDALSLLPIITGILSALVALFALIIKLIELLEKLWPKIVPTIRYLFIRATQIIPVVAVMWYYMYWAIQYHTRFVEKSAFILLVAEPSALIVIYEFIWRKWFYPKLLPLTIKEANEQESTNVTPVENRRQKPNSKSRKIKK
jgi:small-conductance mechanosensitive channel